VKQKLLADLVLRGRRQTFHLGNRFFKYAGHMGLTLAHRLVEPRS
jgi:hypothetical protein